MAEEPEAVASAYNESLLNVRGCQHGLETFYQATGQCWSDALSIFLLFANNLGPVVQRELIEKKESLGESFGSWASANRAFIQEVAGFELNDDKFGNFIQATQDYLYCLYERFKNSKLAKHIVTKNEQAGRRRCDSIVLSHCQAQTAGLANELLMDMGFLVDVAGLTSLREGIATIRKNTKRKENTHKPISAEYDMRKIGKLASVLGRFFYNTLNILELNDKTPESLLPILNGQDSILYLNMNKGEPTFENPVLVNNTETENNIISGKRLSIALSKLFVPVNYNFVVNIPSDVNYSMLVGVVKDGSGHAISFLSCSDGKQYLYDDNLGILVNMNWREIINNKYTNFFYCIKGSIPMLWGYNANPDASGKHKVILSIGGKTNEMLTPKLYNDFHDFLKQKKLDIVYIVKSFDVLYTQAPRAGGAGATGGYRRTRKLSKKVRRRAKASRRVRAP